MQVTLNKLPDFCKNGTLYEILISQENTDYDESFDIPFIIPKYPYLISNIDEFSNSKELENYFGVYENSIPLFVYSIFHRNEVLSFLENNNMYGETARIYQEILSSSFIIKNKQKIIDYINKYVENFENNICDMLQRTFIYEFILVTSKGTKMLQILLEENIIASFDVFFENNNPFNPLDFIYSIENGNSISQNLNSLSRIKFENNFITIEDNDTMRYRYHFYIEVTDFNKFLLIESLSKLSFFP